MRLFYVPILTLIFVQISKVQSELFDDEYETEDFNNEYELLYQYFQLGNIANVSPSSNISQFLRNYPIIRDPDYGKSVPELIVSRGFVPETHDVITEDGYILALFRIVNRKWRKPLKKSIVLMHGALLSPTNFLEATPGGHVDEPIDDNNIGSNLGFELAKRGYDVWLGTVRGDKFSQRHISISSKSRLFWDFSHDEFIRFDVPAIIDYVLTTSNSTKLGWIGHSQGNTIIFGFLSIRPEFANVIEPFIALAPIANSAHYFLPLRLIASQKWIFDILYIVGGPIVPRWLLSVLIPIVGSSCAVRGPDLKLCSFVIEYGAGAGLDYPQLNKTRVPIYVRNNDYSTSSKDIVHYTQMIRNGPLQYFDYGYFGNIRKYGQSTPPIYPLERINTKNTALFSALQDGMADPIDVAIVRDRLKKPLLADIVLSDFNHIDWFWAQNAGNRVYSKVLELLRRYEV